MLCCQLGIEVGFFPLEGLELESILRVLIFLLRCFVIHSELCVLVDQRGLVLLLSRALPLDLHACSGGLGEGLFWEDNSLDYNGVETGDFCLDGGLIGVLSLCGSHWDYFLSWNTVGAAIGIFAPEDYLDTKQT